MPFGDVPMHPTCAEESIGHHSNDCQWEWLRVGFSAQSRLYRSASYSESKRCRRDSLPAFLFDQHAIAVGVETVTLGDRVTVGMQDMFFATEGADQHQEG